MTWVRKASRDMVAERVLRKECSSCRVFWAEEQRVPGTEACLRGQMRKRPLKGKPGLWAGGSVQQSDFGLGPAGRGQANKGMTVGELSSQRMETGARSPPGRRLGLPGMGPGD